MLPKNFNEPMGAPAIFEKQIKIKLLHPASTLESRIQGLIDGVMLFDVQSILAVQVTALCVLQVQTINIRHL
ncbi:MAG: hypothetical protein P8X74_18155 [Reinekea sp.]